MVTSGLSDSEIGQMVEAARRARERSMAYKSKVAWGACILTEDGKLFGGCNIDGIISGEGICAERAAVDHAVVHGYYHYKGLCLFGETMGVPCGVCLQYLLMFCQINDSDIPVVMAQVEGTYEVSSVKQLLPKGYQTKVFQNELRGYKDNPVE